MGNVTFENTPGILFSLGQLLGICFYVFQNPLRHNLRRTILTTLPFAALYMGFGYLTSNHTIYSFWPSYFVSFALGSMMLYYTCRIPKRNAAYFCIRGFLLGEMATSLQWQINRFCLSHFPAFPLHPSVIMILVFAAVFTGVWYSEHPYHEENASLEIRNNNLLSILFLFLFTLSISNYSYLPNSPFRVDSSWDLFNQRTVAYIGGLGVSVMYHIQLLESERRINAEKLNAITLLQYQNYLANESNIALVNQKYHDLKHQLHWLREELNSEEKQQALDTMEQEIKVYETRIDTGNKVLDAILTAAAQTAHEKQIHLHCMVDGSAVNFLSPIDISALFGNAVDNAIEAVSRIEDPGCRIVDITVCKEQLFTRICFRNPFAGELKVHQGLPLTSKSDSRYHGFGVKSIQSVVNKHDGSMTIRTEDGVYELSILFN